MVPAALGRERHGSSRSTARARRGRASATASASSSASGRAAAATRRSVAARRCRKEPSNGPCLRSGSKRRPRDGQPSASGHTPQRGTRARQTVAPRSISACAARARTRPGPLLDAPHVHVDRQHVAPEREACDRVRRVAADAGQLGQIVRPAVRRDLLRGAVEVERAPVVAEPLPLADHVRRRSGGERVHRRPALEPALPARHDAVDLRLLRHHLGDEDRVRIAGPPPGQIAPVLAEPRQKQPLHPKQPRRG